MQAELHTPSYQGPDLLWYFFITNCTSSDVFFLPNSPSLSRLCRFYSTNPDSQSGILKGSPFCKDKITSSGRWGHERITSKGKNRKVKTPSHGSTISCHVRCHQRCHRWVNGWWGMAGWGWMALPACHFKKRYVIPRGKGNAVGRGWNRKFQQSSWMELRPSRASSFVTHPSNSTRKGSIWTIHYNCSTWAFRPFCLGFLY